MRGEFYIDPATGHVVRTGCAQTAATRVRTRIVRQLRLGAPDSDRCDLPPGPEVKAWVPVEMKELYERRIEVLTCTATYSNFRRFETAARILPPK